MDWKDPEAVKAYQKAYRDSHKDDAKAYQKKYYAAHKDKKNASTKAYDATHKNERNAYFKVYRDAHREERAAYNKAYHVAHKEERSVYGKAYYESRKEEMKTFREEHSIDLVCKQCGKHIKKYVYPGEAGEFCSLECSNKWRTGPNSYTWRGGISFAPYCPKFTKALREEVRSQFGQRCFLSGKEENGEKLAVHHCDYLKSQGCQGQRWSLLPLDHGWHSKTNFDRWYWFALLRDYWAYKYLTFHGMDIYEGPDRTAWLWEMYNQDAST